jgi:arabinoxylan arabinofuranohydrolase
MKNLFDKSKSSWYNNKACTLTQIFIFKEFLMKTKLIIAMVMIAFIVGVFLTGCEDTTGGNDRDRVTVTFKLGDDYEGNNSAPEPILVLKGTSVGKDRWPTNPRWSRHTFEGWKNSGGTVFTATTTINEDVTLTAGWEERINQLAEPLSAEELAALFSTTESPSGGEPFPAQLSDAKKIWGMKNPSMTFAYVADPTPMVYCPNIENSGATEGHSCDQCTLYVYGSNDTLYFNADGTPNTSDFGRVIQGLRAVSTKDLWNWTDHGILNFVAKESSNPLFDYPTTKIAPYANDTWAPSAEWKIVGGKPKFFLYWCNSGNNTSVVVSEAGPLGPFTNPGLSNSMVNKNMVGFGSVGWLFDPGTFIDYDGKAYMVLGGEGGSANPGNVRRVEMNDDMYSIVGNGPTLVLPWHFEATDIWKWQGRYYINYTNNWGSNKPQGFGSIDVAYVMNEAGPLEPFPGWVWDDEAGGKGHEEVNSTPNTPDPNKANRLMPNGAYGDSTNHASLFDFRDKTYLVYHASSACQAWGMTRLRTAHLVDIEVNPDGTLKPVTMGAKGVAQVGDGFNPYDVVEAETMAIEGGVYTKGKGNETTASNGISVASIDTGDWLGLYGVNFDKQPGGATVFNAKVKLPTEDYIGAIEIRLDPEQEGYTAGDPTADNARLTTGDGRQSRIKGGTVVGRVQLKLKQPADVGKWLTVFAELPEPVTGNHNLAFVFYSSNGAKIESFRNYQNTRANDGRDRDVGFEIDQWWFE